MKHSLTSCLVIASLLGLSTACQGPSEAEKIIDKAITEHGGEQYQHAVISFKFRDRYYRATIDQGRFVYESVFEDSLGHDIHDTLSNKGFARTLEGKKQELSTKDSAAYANSLNSVIYFALLPHFLDDPAAHKELVGADTIQGEPYYEISVTFEEDQGGKDFQDEFMYWIHQEHYTMDYLAYSYHTEGGGTRFREAFNTRGVNGIRFADYINYESTVADFDLQDYDSLFEAGQVKEFSRIILEDVTVENISDDGNPPAATAMYQP